jgi:hypothetical protein
MLLLLLGSHSIKHIKHDAVTKFETKRTLSFAADAAAFVSRARPFLSTAGDRDRGDRAAAPLPLAPSAPPAAAAAPPSAISSLFSSAAFLSATRNRSRYFDISVSISSYSVSLIQGNGINKEGINMKHNA